MLMMPDICNQRVPGDQMKWLICCQWIPRPKDLGQNGISQAIAKGDDVWSFKTISYNNDGTYVTTAKLRIREAKTGKAKTVEKSFDDLYTLPQNKDKGKVSTEPKGRTNASAAEKSQNKNADQW